MTEEQEEERISDPCVGGRWRRMKGKQEGRDNIGCNRKDGRWRSMNQERTLDMCGGRGIRRKGRKTDVCVRNNGRGAVPGKERAKAVRK
jgi:hypothetical protein